MAKNDNSPPGFGNSAADSSGLDEFLSAGLSEKALPDRPAPGAGVVLVQLAELDHQDVGDLLMIIPADDDGERFTVDAAVMAAFRGEVQAWLSLLRDQGQMVTELLPLSVRDQSARKIVNHLLDVAYRSPKRSWMAMLPTGRQVVIAPSHTVRAIGFEGICRIAHTTAIATAQNAGRPFNERALSFYQAAHPAEMH